ncbi:hypothetical protein AVEN_23572-1 [Araneus ventricosus]|uniref:Uncharacterized protein n=1 Tax=Araneus ventricosus TaxID=182803 RepID=A0A4Y2LA61_ARAVE|nr:hypothetical protein AVEN_23572-1 [Araneus ventricosus]
MRFSQYINADLGNSQKKSFIALLNCCIATYFYHILRLAAGLRDPKDPGSKPESCKSAAYANLVGVASDMEGQKSSRWFRAEVCRWDASSILIV